ncbi:proline racemase family protein [Undibacterium flavidum]|uniref:Proline racemase family protein n=1 Tax=Undibacterium flavidum TaxID=2762297 RepID=A0ABR6YE15_9BURK|nr:proline racemase family protein [Undibacterium flavidum]MBC3874806.1 proline racemase family protein [Undibacterium flavidum]
MTNSLANRFAQWRVPTDWQAITSLDCHTGGEPLRIITSGFPVLAGHSILEKRRDCLKNFDHLRTALMFEPRGHADMYGALITEPERADSDFGALFLHNEGYSSMCGHAIIALTKTAIEAGVVAKTLPQTRLRIDVPCGQILAYADVDETGIQKIYFDNVPSFVAQLDQRIEVEGIGMVTYTLAYGGAFYAYVDAPSIGLSLAFDNHRQIIDYGRRIKQAVMASRAVVHPYEDDLSFLYGTIFSAPAEESGVRSRNVCIFAEGELDRSPTGSGVSGQVAILHARGLLGVGQEITIESILGSQFQVSVQQTLQYGPYAAVIPRVQGTAHVIGKNTFYIDPTDPLQQGFILR